MYFSSKTPIKVFKTKKLAIKKCTTKNMLHHFVLLKMGFLLMSTASQAKKIISRQPSPVEMLNKLRNELPRLFQL